MTRDGPESSSARLHRFRRRFPCGCPHALLVSTCALILAAACAEGDGNPRADLPAGGSTAAGSGGDGTAGTRAGASGGSASGTAGAGGSPSTAGGSAGAGGAARGGSPSAGGDAGAAGSEGGSGGGSAGKGTGTPEICSFEIEDALSAHIPTVGVVDWSTDLQGLTAASIEFSLDDPAPDEINRGSGGPIEITGTSQRALLLGLKPDRTYTYRILASAGDVVCVSPDRTLTTGAALGAPSVARTSQNAAAQARGFIVTSGGYPFMSSGPELAYVIDADGDVVWWADSPAQCSRALLDWEGRSVWMVDTNPTISNGGEVRRIGMDGAEVLEDVEGLSMAHHDIAVVPGGIVAALLWINDGTAASELVERSPDGTLRTVVRLGEDVFKPVSGNEFHANAVLYHPADDTYTVGDLYAKAYVKLTRDGRLLWQFGGDCTGAPAPKCASADFSGNHGHHLLDDGSIVSFHASFGTSPTYEHRLSERGSLLDVARLWSYEVEGTGSEVLGDVQRLPNGNTLVVFSTKGLIHEVAPTGELVQTLSSVSPAGATVPGAFGYANFRETLYGPPLR